ncbi:MAG TPA: ferredoxin family protein [Dehalococcoidales bacterium]|nr:ferredoxin family protein [Dehalococcoidales bacterium]
MNKKKTYMLPNPPAPNIPIEFDESICNGCNRCVEICRNDVFMPNPEQKKPPIILYSDECWFCGCCVMECNRPGAIKLRHPLNQTVPVGWKRKNTGETYRLGMRNPPPPDTRPPSG